MKPVSKARKKYICGASFICLAIVIPLIALGIEAGQLVIDIQDAHGNGLYSNVKVYKAKTREIVRVFNSSQAILKLPPGNYDIEIYYLELQKLKQMRNVALKAGEQLEKIVRFEFGQVVINVFGPEGKGHYSAVKVYKAGTGELVRIHSSSQAWLKLPLGRYDVQVYSMDLKKDQWVRDISVTDGGMLEKTIRFDTDEEMRDSQSPNTDPEKRPIKTDILQMSGLTAEERVIHTDMLLMTGLAAEERIVKTRTLQMTGLNYQERNIRTDTLQMTGMGSE